MNIREMAETYEPYIIDQRRYFHKHPELSWEEKETTNAIAYQLEEMGLETRRFARTGLYADIHGENMGPESKTVLLRADIDALPVAEKTNAPYTSMNPGVMHACGHDGHIAMLLGAAKILCQIRRELRGRVRLLFQPAEETAAGAAYCVEQGALEGVDFAFGAHIMGDFDAPYVNVEAGPRFASADMFKIEVNGVSSHGSAPHTAKDAIMAAAGILTNLSAIVSSRTDPLEALVVSVGVIRAGTRFNIISGSAVMEGTVRAHSAKIRSNVEAMMREIISHSAAALGCTAKLHYEYLIAPVVNDDTLTALVQRSAEALYGARALATREKTMGSEDFAAFSEKVPAVYAFLGGRNREKGITAFNHSDYFDMDEAVMQRGAALHAQVAVDYLNQCSPDHKGVGH